MSHCSIQLNFGHPINLILAWPNLRLGWPDLVLGLDFESLLVLLSW